MLIQGAHHLLHAVVSVYKRSFKVYLTLHKFVESQLIHKTQSKARVLEHVVETQVLYLILGRVNVFVPVLVVRLNHKGGRIACF